MIEQGIGTWNPRRHSIVRVCNNEYIQKEGTIIEVVRKYGEDTLWYVLAKSGSHVKLGKDSTTLPEIMWWDVFRESFKMSNGNYIPVSCLKSVSIREAKKLGITYGDKLPEVTPKIAIKPVNMVGNEFNKMRNILRKI